MDPLKPVRPGEAFRPSAAAWNTMLAGAQLARAGRTANPTGAAGAFNVTPHATCLVLNTESSVSTLPAQSVIAYGPSPIDIVGDSPLFNARPTFTVAVPSDADEPAAVTLEPIRGQSAGRAVTVGPVACTVDVTDADHTRCKPIPGVTTKFRSSASGGYPILDREAGTGDVAAVVLLGGGGGGHGESGGDGATPTLACLGPFAGWDADTCLEFAVIAGVGRCDNITSMTTDATSSGDDTWVGDNELTTADGDKIITLIRDADGRPKMTVGAVAGTFVGCVTTTVTIDDVPTSVTWLEFAFGGTTLCDGERAAECGENTFRVRARCKECFVLFSFCETTLKVPKKLCVSIDWDETKNPSLAVCAACSFSGVEITYGDITIPPGFPGAGSIIKGWHGTWPTDHSCPWYSWSGIENANVWLLIGDDGGGGLALQVAIVGFPGGTIGPQWQGSCASIVAGQVSPDPFALNYGSQTTPGAFTTTCFDTSNNSGFALSVGACGGGGMMMALARSAPAAPAEQPSPARHPLPCAHEGAVVEACKSCGPSEGRHVRQCFDPAGNRDRCTREYVGPGVQSCAACPDYEAAGGG